ncbi:chromosome segregation protein SMC [Pseudoflavonifractor sp. An85]|uniref:chromosome segregation protein SMC n=1 Tax=Pseudoflavonifractor sp. An85 TaxID=1965661 RepID=UPI000B381295|nr:chromosome segregation protein SMC [Pseudoflavonifractor sp. An85]
MHGLYLKALEIQGFKSFPEKTVLTFGADITVIVGPNGSGKSNIADAIRWVMGEQSTRTLRGNKMEDVIFDGTAKRKSLGFAEVTLVLDNSQHLLALEEQEVAVTRRYYRSGESEYFINRRSCRLRDINELFMDTGLGREGYSIIGQGKIDEILSVKSSDRREVFEEAAGISKFRHRKEEAERKLERTQENLIRINDKIDELKLQVEPLRIQAEKTQKYLVMRDELRGLEISVWLDQLEQLRANSIQLNTALDTARAHREQLRQELENLYQTAEDYAQQMQDYEVQAEEIRRRQSQLEQQLHQGQSQLELLRRDQQNNTDNICRIQDELEQQAGRAGSLAQQVAQRRERLAELEGELARLQAELDRLDAHSQELLHCAGSLKEELAQLQEQERLEQATASETKALLSALSAAGQELMDREESVVRELMEQESQKQKQEVELNQCNAKLERLTAERDSISNTLAGYQVRVQTRQRKAQQVQETCRRLEMEQNNLQSRIQMLSEMEKLYEGYSKSVKLLMGEAKRGGISGVRGPVAGLIHVPDAYTVAIEIALGGAMQHVVMERDQDAKQAIGWLKRRDGGRATFLPMNTIRPSTLRESGLETQRGYVGLAHELIEYHSDYQNVMANLLGRVVITQNLDCAMAIARQYGHRFRIVTLDGQVLNAGGSMTGGSISRSAGILSRANELVRLRGQMSELEAKAGEAKAQLVQAQREWTAAQYELDAAANQLRQAEDGVLTQTQQVEHCTQQVEQIQKRCQVLRQERASLQQRSRENAESIQKAQTRIVELEGSAAVLQAQSQDKTHGQSQLQQQLEACSQEKATIRAQWAGLEGEQAAMQVNLNQLEQLQRDLSGDTAGRQARIAQLEEENQALQRQMVEQERLVQGYLLKKQQGEGELSAMQSEKLELEGKRNQADRLAREKNNHMLSMEREVSVLEQKAMTAAMEESQILDKLWESYQLSHEAARAQRVTLESVPRAQKRIGELKRGISALGNINPDAVEEYRRIYERYSYFTDQRDDVTASKKELEEIIRQITQEMKEIFQEKFLQIQEAFQETFLELFRGGKATLELEDPEDILGCGIEIKAQPPGKALKIISLLSGGEKAFVAIALYFAILKVRPTPFCVMDEIEAALDDNNVVRYAQYLRRMSDRTQFIAITHRRGTMEEADVLYGVTMQEQGISRILTINLNEMEEQLQLQD